MAVKIPQGTNKVNFFKKMREDKQRLLLLEQRQMAINKIKDALWLLKNMDEDLKKQGHGRKARRQFWSDLVHSEEIRQDVFDRLLRQYEAQEAYLKTQNPLSFKEKVTKWFDSWDNRHAPILPKTECKCEEQCNHECDAKVEKTDV